MHKITQANTKLNNVSQNINSLMEIQNDKETNKTNNNQLLIQKKEGKNRNEMEIKK